MYLFLILFTTVQSFITPEIRRTSGGNDFCIVDGRPYRNGERIPRDHVCHICLCHQGRAECSWMNCPPPPEGCDELTFDKSCNPMLYNCSIPEYLREPRGLKRRRASDTDASGLDFANQSTGDCMVLGVPYRTGDLMGIATKFCLECRCARQSMFCSPRCCFKYASLDENVSDREAAVRRPMTPDKHPLYHLFNE